MDRPSHSQTTGLIALMTIITAVVAYFSLHVPQAQHLPPITIKDPPAAVPGSSAQSDTESQSSLTVPAQGPTAAQAEIVVHVAGAVFRPDVYRLPIGSRVNDAIRAAGGPTQAADTNSMNLAAVVSDGARVYVPQFGEQAVRQPQESDTGTAMSQTSQPAAPQPTLAEQPSETTGGQEAAAGKITEPGQGAVNINLASEEELQRLPGIGPAIAARIVAYRQASGGFSSIEELKNVSGIGEKKFAKLSAFIVVK